MERAVTLRPDMAEAQYNLGIMYDRGEGVPQDFVQAHLWFNISASRMTGEPRETAVNYSARAARRRTYPPRRPRAAYVAGVARAGLAANPASRGQPLISPLDTSVAGSETRVAPSR